MNLLIYYWKLYFLKRERERRLKDAHTNRWKNCRHGTVFKQRQIIQEWYTNEWLELRKKYR